MLFIISAFCVQFIFLLSVFDIHFQSPIVHGIKPFPSRKPGLAKRLVLISADGLRADSFLSYGTDRQPNAAYLRTVIQSRGKWGISNTRVPTESRPGHVAMIAGFYEDPSAVFKGWKENPVEFDSVFNQSSYTFAWGSPDILPMFAKGGRNNIIINTYSSEYEDFTGHDAYKLDEWVFEHFEKFLNLSLHNDTLKGMLNQDGVIFFLHLLGLDTNGHTNKPYSKIYYDNLRFVDKGIARIEALISNHFQDNKTVYVFTADHGMTDWGSHGAGDPSETRTPLVVWGSGIEPEKNNDFEQNRIDIEQADIAPLMTALLGINFPVNSVGKLPLKYLGNDWSFKAHAALCNARQLRALYEALLNQQKERSLSWTFRTFRPLEPNRGLDLINEIEKYINKESYEQSIELAQRLMELSLEGKDFYYKYDQIQLKICITLAYLGWTGILFVFITKEQLKYQEFGRILKNKHRKSDLVNRISFALGGFIFIVLTVERAPFLYYCYHLVPLGLWWYFFRHVQMFRQIDFKIRHVFQIIVVIAGIELLAGAFFYRWILSGLLCLLSLWPFFDQMSSSRRDSNFKFMWLINCLMLSIFPILPPVGKDSLPILVDIAGILITVTAIWTSLMMHHDRDRTVLISYVLMIPITFYVRHSVHDSLVQGQGLPFFEQCISWCLLGLPCSLPFIGPSKMWPRLIGIGITLAPPFLLLSVSYEGIFYLILLFTVTTWIALEARTSLSPWKQLRQSYFFLFFTFLSFFGLGNIASVNSFDPSGVRCFVTTFSPFIMAALLLWKIIVPFIIVSTALWAITVENRISIRGIYLFILLLSSGMALHFFHLVTSTGSWLDIGTSISHYVIVQSTILFVMILNAVVQILTYGPIYFRKPSKYDKD